MLESSIIFIGNSHPVYSPYRQRKENKQLITRNKTNGKNTYYIDLCLFGKKSDQSIELSKENRKSIIEKDFFEQLIELVRKECQGSVEGNQFLNYGNIIKELSKNYDVIGIEENMLSIVVAYQCYVIEVEQLQTDDSKACIEILQRHIENYGVKELFHNGIIEAEKDLLHNRASQKAKNYYQNNLMTKNQTSDNNQTTKLKNFVEQNRLSHYFKDLCQLLIKADDYETEDIIKAMQRKYSEEILSINELTPLIEAYKYMTSVFTEIKDNSEKSQRIKPILK